MRDFILRTQCKLGNTVTISGLGAFAKASNAFAAVTDVKLRQIKTAEYIVAGKLRECHY